MMSEIGVDVIEAGAEATASAPPPERKKRTRNLPEYKPGSGVFVPDHGACRYMGHADTPTNIGASRQFLSKVETLFPPANTPFFNPVGIVVPKANLRPISSPETLEQVIAILRANPQAEAEPPLREVKQTLSSTDIVAIAKLASRLAYAPPSDAAMTGKATIKAIRLIGSEIAALGWRHPHAANFVNGNVTYYHENICEKLERMLAFSDLGDDSTGNLMLKDFLKIQDLRPSNRAEHIFPRVRLAAVASAIDASTEKDAAASRGSGQGSGGKPDRPARAKPWYGEYARGIWAHGPAQVPRS